MPGMRSEEEILKAFEGLDKAPGSIKPRRALDEGVQKKRKEIYTQLNEWDANPIIKNLGGQEVEVFTISALAEALGKTVVSIRLWEKRGYIPIAPYRLRSKSLNGKKVNGNRVYTRELIEITIEEFQKRNVLHSERVEWSKLGDLTEALVSRWRAAVAIHRES